MTISPNAPRAALLLLAFLSAVACSDSDSGDLASADAGSDASAMDTDDPGADVTTNLDSDLDTAPPPCTDARRPIVVAHGFLASCDTYANHAMRFAANGYCLSRIYPFDWNTLDQGAESELLLDAYIDQILTETGAAQVDLAGHSAGGGLGYTYLSDPDRAAKVAHYAHIASRHFEGPAGPEGGPAVPTLNLWSEADLIIDSKGDIDGATNVRLTEEDHYAVATTEASFDALYRFFNDGQTPTETRVIPEEGPLFISGKALTLGENIPVSGGTVQVFAVDPETAARRREVASLTTDAQGRWGPLVAEPDTHYEFRVQGTEPDSLPVHYYREPFVRSNPFIYLRTLPGPDSVAGRLLSLIPFSETASVVIVFMANRSLNDATDSLTVNGVELATPTLASPDQTTIALFLYDSDQNGVSDETPVALFASFPFLNAFDLFFPADLETPITLTLNGRTLKVLSWPSASEGATIAVFE